MKRQKVVITLSTGEVVVFAGPAQVDTSKPIKVRKFQFTVPRDHDVRPADDSFEDIFGPLLRAMGKGNNTR